jgi:hypothetical protein
VDTRVQSEETRAGDDLVEIQTVASGIAHASCGGQWLRVPEMREHHGQTGRAAFDDIELIDDGHASASQSLPDRVPNSDEHAHDSPAGAIPGDGRCSCTSHMFVLRGPPRERKKMRVAIRLFRVLFWCNVRRLICVTSATRCAIRLIRSARTNRLNLGSPMTAVSSIRLDEKWVRRDRILLP